MVEVCTGWDLIRFAAACFGFGVAFTVCGYGIFGK